MLYGRTLYAAFACLTLLLRAGLGSAEQADARLPSLAFRHPGLLHTRADLDRMRQRVAAGDEPWKSGFETLRTNRYSRADWRLNGPYETVTRGGKNQPGNQAMAHDGNAAYQNALMWCVTGQTNHAEKAVEILNAWSVTLKRMDGPEKQLSGGLSGFKFVNAAELMRHTYSAWSPTDIAHCEKMFREALLPAVADFATFANGNWDAACIKTLLAIGVFCDDVTLAARAINYFRSGEGNGCLTHYIVNDTGQAQESGRDQQHVQLGLGLLAEACEIAWNQDVDLYGEADNRLLKGFEYTARYNLGYEVPFVPWTDTTGKYRHTRISPKNRGELRPIYELVWAHYHTRRELPAPFTGAAAEKLRPEGEAFDADHPGFGTLLFSLPQTTR